MISGWIEPFRVISNCGTSVSYPNYTNGTSTENHFSILLASCQRRPSLRPHHLQDPDSARFKFSRLAYGTPNINIAMVGRSSDGFRDTIPSIGYSSHREEWEWRPLNQPYQPAGSCTLHHESQSTSNDALAPSCSQSNQFHSKDHKGPLPRLN